MKRLFDHRFRLLLVLLCLVVGTVRAETVPGLYQAAVPVTGQGADDLRSGAAAGLGEVLVRVSGRTDAAAAPGVADALASPEQYVDQYRYDHANDGALLLRLQFAPAAVDKLLQSAGLPVWGADRPRIVAFLVQPDGSFVGTDSAPVLIAALQQEAKRRGLPLQFPLGDLDDLRSLTASDVAAGDIARARTAGQRYHADALLLGQVTPAGSGWQASWYLVNGQQRISLPGTLAAGIDQVADTLAAEYATHAAAGTGSQDLLLQASGIDNFDDYAGLLTYLQRIGSVKAVLPQHIDGPVVTVRLQLDGSLDQLERQFALDRRLLPVPQPAANGAVPGNAVYYRWQPHG